MTEFSLARQPILDSTLQLYAYELLFRGCKDKSSGVSLTSDVLATAIFDIGLEKLIGNNLAFINMSYQDIMSSTVDSLPTSNLVLELLEDIKIDDTLVKRVKELAEQGFMIALDDFIYAPEWEPLIDVASIIKLDLTVLSNDKNHEIIQKLKNRGIKFLAEKVETYEEFQLFKDMGCDYFQGYFLCRPETLSGKSLTSGAVAKTRLLAEINDIDSSANKIAELIQQDPSLTYKLLKYLNSAYFSFKNPIENINQAVIMLGLQGIRKWTTLLCLRDLSDKPSELTRVALIRARLAENIANNTHSDSPSSFFLTGLFSTLDAMLDTDMNKILSSVPLEKNIKVALTDKKGNLGHVIQGIIDYEKIPVHDSFDKKTDFTTEDYIEACSWADEIMTSLSKS